jgi:ABC-type dipeptide/oligopeptide/nickel transport system permease component
VRSSSPGHQHLATVITETIFAWPGVGRLLMPSISFRDYPVVLGGILLIAVTGEVEMR